MNRKMKITIFITCAFLMCLISTSALATTYSNAYIYQGQYRSTGPRRTLANAKFSFKSQNDSSSQANEALYGSAYTGNTYGPYNRVTNRLYPGETSTTYTLGPYGSGYFFAQAENENNACDGYAKTWQ